jgi:NAD(P)-dependent dehydrogenase (short-subunit alcohol dehydrogenase family)
MGDFRQTYMKLFPIALPAAGSFKDQTAVVTGGTGGLGLATAVHLINLGAREVIISSRSEQKGQDAVSEIERLTHGKAKGKVRALTMDMSRYESVVAFADEVQKVKNGKGGADLVVLNAGQLASDFEESPEGW